MGSESHFDLGSRRLSANGVLKQESHPFMADVREGGTSPLVGRS